MELTETCPKCGQPRDLDIQDQTTFNCGTWMLGYDVMQSGDLRQIQTK